MKDSKDIRKRINVPKTRRMWGFDPTTRVKEDKTKFNRNRQKRADRKEIEE